MSKIRATIYIVKSTTRELTASQFSFLKSRIIKGKLLDEIVICDTQALGTDLTISRGYIFHSLIFSIKYRDYFFPSSTLILRLI